eukprot:scpid85375/ scgid21099/ 
MSTEYIMVHSLMRPVPSASGMSASPAHMCQAFVQRNSQAELECVIERLPTTILVNTTIDNGASSTTGQRRRGPSSRACRHASLVHSACFSTANQQGKILIRQESLNPVPGTVPVLSRVHLSIVLVTQQLPVKGERGGIFQHVYPVSSLAWRLACAHIGRTTLWHHES